MNVQAIQNLEKIFAAIYPQNPELKKLLLAELKRRVEVLS